VGKISLVGTSIRIGGKKAPLPGPIILTLVTRKAEDILQNLGSWAPTKREVVAGRNILLTAILVP